MLPSQGDWFDRGWEAKILLVTGAQPRKGKKQAKKKNPSMTKRFFKTSKWNRIDQKPLKILNSQIMDEMNLKITYLLSSNYKILF